MSVCWNLCQGAARCDCGVQICKYFEPKHGRVTAESCDQCCLIICENCQRKYHSHKNGKKIYVDECWKRCGSNCDGCGIRICKKGVIGHGDAEIKECEICHEVQCERCNRKNHRYCSVKRQKVQDKPIDKPPIEQNVQEETIQKESAQKESIQKESIQKESIQRESVQSAQKEMKETQEEKTEASDSHSSDEDYEDEGDEGDDSDDSGEEEEETDEGEDFVTTSSPPAPPTASPAYPPSVLNFKM